jgi:hypothetical protein
MALISGTIPSLINGISQQPATLRLNTQGEIQENGLSHIARGLEKRPCTEHVAQIEGISSTTSDDVFIHTIRRSEDEAYALIMKGGTTSGTNGSTANVNTEVKLIDLTGYATGVAGSEVYVLDKEQTTSYPSGQHSGTTNGITSSVSMATNSIPNNYFKNFSASTETSPKNLFSPNSLSSTTIADFSFILNKTQPVKQSVDLPSTRPYEALLYYKIGDFGAKYQALITEWNVGLDGERLTKDLLNSELPLDHTSYDVAHTNPATPAHVFRRAMRNRYKIVFATPDNEVESRSGLGEAGNSESINNQASVRVNNIANAIKTGADASEIVHLIRTDGAGTFGSSNYKIIVSTGTTDNTSLEYTGDKGVKSKGVVTGTMDSTASNSTHDMVWTPPGTAQYVCTTQSSTTVLVPGSIAVTEAGKAVYGDGIPNGTTVVSVVLNTSFVLSQAATASASVTLTIGEGTNHGLNDLITDNARFKILHDPNTSVIHIKNNTYPITIELTDGKGDTYSRSVNGSDEVPNFGYLPGSANIETGFIAKISGDKSSGQDDYYVNWTGSVWKEVVQPMYPGGLEITGATGFITPYTLNATATSAAYDPAYVLDALKRSRYRTIDSTTMPMQLFKAFGKVYDGTTGQPDAIYFILKPVEWADREAGDNLTNPFPSFSNYDPFSSPNGVYTINDIFFHRNRLGFISDENVILSESGGYYNFFHNTVLSVLDTAVIDVAVSNNQVAILKSAIPFQENLILFSDLQQFKLTSDAFLTPTSVMVDVATNFETSTVAKPVPAGKTIFFPFQRGAFSGIREYSINIASETNDANEITAHVPEYVEGVVKKLAVSSNEEVLLILSETDRRVLKVYKYYYSDAEKMQSAWSTWTFDAEIIDMSFIGSIAFFLFRRGTQIYLEKLNLSVDNATSIMDDEIGVRLDRRKRVTSMVYTLKDYTPTPIKNATETAFTADHTTDFITSNTHGLVNTQIIRVVGTDLPAGLAIDTDYYVREKTTHTFKVELSVGSGAINITDNGTPTNNWVQSAWQINHTSTANTVVQTSTTGTGTLMKFTTVTDAYGNPTFTITTQGSGYNLGDTITVTDPGNTINTAIVTPYILPYGDTNYDKLTAATTDNVTLDTSIVDGWGSKIKIQGLNNGYLPRVGQLFYKRIRNEETAALEGNSGVTYKITAVTVDPDNATKAQIKITPSVAKEAPWSKVTISGTTYEQVLQFEDREPIYVLETGEEVPANKVVGYMTTGSDYSKKIGNTTPDVFAGVRYDFRYQFSEQFVKSNENSINSGRLQMKNFEISYANSGNFDVEVAPRPFDDLYRTINTKEFTTKILGSVLLGNIDLETGVLRVPVYCNSRDARITVTSKAWHPVALQSADWEALQVLRNQRI